VSLLLLLVLVLPEKQRKLRLGKRNKSFGEETKKFPFHVRLLRGKFLGEENFSLFWLLEKN